MGIINITFLHTLLIKKEEQITLHIVSLCGMLQP